MTVYHSAKSFPVPLQSSLASIRLEIAVDNPEAVLAAANGGAERLELCASLGDGGMTPSLGFIEWTLSTVSIPVHCMVRPRAGNFRYTAEELQIMLRDIQAMRTSGVPGIVAGVLTADDRVDVEAMQRLKEAAHPMRVCFHRAFDLAVDRRHALEDVIRSGAEILLTSGGAVSLAAGAEEVTRIVEQAAGRIEIMGGAGVRVENAAELWRTVPIDTLHASLRSPWATASLSGSHTANMGSRDEEALYTVREDDVRAMMAKLEPRSIPVR